MTEIALPHSVESDPRKFARDLYFKGWRISSIARHMEISRATIESWRQRDEWDKASPLDKVESSLEARLMLLIDKDKKGNNDYAEIDSLGRLMERMVRIRRYGETGKPSDLNPNLAERNKGPRKGTKNEFSPEQEKRLMEAFQDTIFDYQKVWYRNRDQRIRNLLKSRQIGATWYFAREALVDALETGRNQIFLSASKSQAHVFKEYIAAFAKDAADVEITGSPIILPNNATLYFLGTNSRTAQSYHGNLYFDEYFWVPKFKVLNKVASGMSMHAHWRKTYISTPSTTAHEAYPFWTGAHYNVGRPRAEHIEIDIGHEALKDGRLCEDGQWRQILTVVDAVAGGCNLFELEQLRREYSADEFANLLMCQFIDDTASLFAFAELQRCMVDTWEVWEDVKFLAPRPYGFRPVWIGYDPALSGDSAGCVVLAPPLVPGGKFRVLEKIQFRKKNFEEQAKAIKELTTRYTVSYIGIDTTGIGQGVFQLVQQFFPGVRGFHYSPEVKGQLVLKGISVISNGRLEFDAGWSDLVAAFLAIKKSVTPSGNKVTYQSSYNEEIGHADLAWATLHALANEPLEGVNASNTSIMEIS